MGWESLEEEELLRGVWLGVGLGYWGENRGENSKREEGCSRSQPGYLGHCSGVLEETWELGYLPFSLRAPSIQQGGLRNPWLQRALVTQVVVRQVREKLDPASLPLEPWGWRRRELLPWCLALAAACPQLCFGKHGV